MRIAQSTRFAMIAGLLGAAFLMGSPLTSSADPGGKWWAGGGKGNGREKNRAERRQESRGGQQWSGRQQRGGQQSGREQAHRGGQQWSGQRQQERSGQRQWSGGDRAPARSYSRGYSGPVTRYRGTPSYSGNRTYRTYSAPVWGGSRQFTGRRFYRSYGSVPVYRDYVSVRFQSHYQPVYGWRYYCPPAYYYPTHVVYVRPVRFFVAANFAIGGLGISAAYADPGPVYGCNFCDARFSDYDDYEYHVGHCAHAPQGYRIIAEQWDQNQVDQWRDDQVGDRRYEDYNRDYDDDQGDELDR